MRINRFTNTNARRRGTAMVAVAISMVAIGMLSLALLAVNSSAAKAQRHSKDECAAMYVAEAGIADALLSIRNGGEGDLGEQADCVDFGGSSYWVEADNNDDGTLSLVATGLSAVEGARIELVVERTYDELFQWGAFGDDTFHMDSQAKIDSYDSAAGSYADQAVNGSGSTIHANSNGSTGSNGDVALDQNALVYGNAMPGSDGTISILGNAQVSGSIEPLDADLEMPEIELPSIGTSGPLDLAKDSVTSIGPGELHYNRLRAGTGSTLHVYGPATVIFDSFSMYSGSSVIVHPENGPVEFYVQKDFILNSNTLVTATTQLPADVEFNLLSDNIINVDVDVDLDLDELEFDSNAKFFGTIYAPEAMINIDSNFEMFGCLIAQQLDLSSNCRVHYDERLYESKKEGIGGFRTLCWRELPYRPSHNNYTN